MLSIIQSANSLFGSTVSFCKEILFEFNCEYKITKNKLPQTDDLVAFLSLKPDRDNIAISITTESRGAFISKDGVWVDSYKEFVSSLYDDDELTVSITIKKSTDNGKLSIFSLREFSKFLTGLTIEQVFENFTMLFRDCGEHITFQLLDTNGALWTNSISFSDNDGQWVTRRSREELLKNCQDASVFLERARICLIPEDFEIDVFEGSGFEEIKALFDRLKNILSYVYLANTATVINNKAVLQFNPSNKGYEYELNELSGNSIVSQIYSWVFKDDSCVDKAGIARKIICTYCSDKESILTIDERILNSIKSDYVIYQKNHVDQYIDMKNRISDYIVDSAGKIQDLSHDIADAFRNNFVAVIVFLMTVLLTDSIDFSQFFGKKISPKVAAVCGVFTVATVLYFIVTIIMGNQKWRWLKQSYNDLKKNYENVFVSKDLEDAFNHDEPLKNAEKQYKAVKKKIGAIWILLIVVMSIFTALLFFQGRQSSVQKTQIEATEYNDIEMTDSEVQ